MQPNLAICLGEICYGYRRFYWEVKTTDLLEVSVLFSWNFYCRYHSRYQRFAQILYTLVIKIKRQSQITLPYKIYFSQFSEVNVFIAYPRLPSKV